MKKIKEKKRQQWIHFKLEDYYKCKKEWIREGFERGKKELAAELRRLLEIEDTYT